MKKQYIATTCTFNSEGEKLEEVRDFPKDRDGLRAAYKFVQSAEDWIIWYGDEVVDQSI